MNSVLVTGSAGSLGTALCAELSAQSITHRGYDLKDGQDVLDSESLEQTVEEMQPEVVFHLAGVKHAAFGEEQPWATTHTNVVGTLNLLSSPLPKDCRVVLASSCKAANPETVYGATKLIAERMVLNAGHSVARFYNVIESDGNVFQTWRGLHEEEPLLVTDCFRLFITITDAVRLLLAASHLPPGRYVPAVSRRLHMRQAAAMHYPHRRVVEIKRRRGDRQVEPLLASCENVDHGTGVDHVVRISNYHDE